MKIDRVVWAGFVLWLLFSMTLFAQTRLAVAANMSYAIKPLIEAYQQMHPQSRIEYTIGSSGKLATQILHGAAYDLFFSADMKYPNILYDAKATLTTPVVYACGALVLFSRTPRDFSLGLKVLESPAISRVAIASPITAPYGAATKEVLVRTKLHKRLKEKFVYGESIAQTIAYTMRAADVGFIAASALYAPQMKQYQQDKHYIIVDSSLYHPIKQGMVLLGHAIDNTDAKAFYDFMQSNRAKTILKAYGYSL